MFTHTILIISLLSPSQPVRASESANADAETVDEAWLQYIAKDVVITVEGGSAFVGRVTVIAPQGLTLQLPSGGTHTVPLEAVKSIQFHQAEPSPSADPQASVPAVPPEVDEPSPRLGLGSLRLHIGLTRDADVRLIEITENFQASSGLTTVSGEASRSVCAAPCDMVLDSRSGRDYYFGGPGVTKSNHFSLTGLSGDIEAQVRPGRRGVAVGGVLLLGTGALVSLLSMVPFLNADKDEDIYDGIPAEPNYAPGVAVLLTGAVVMAIGLGMVLSGRTKFTIGPRRFGRSRGFIRGRG